MSGLASTPFAAAQEVTKRLGLPQSFLLDLRADSAWTFVLKSEALVESALTYVLVRAVTDARLHPFLERLGMAQKLRLAESLALMDDRHRRAAQYLLELRNYLAHDARRVAFSMPEYFADPRKWREFLKAMTYEDESIPLVAAQDATWIAVLSILSEVYVADEHLAVLDKRAEYLRRLMEGKVGGH